MEQWKAKWIMFEDCPPNVTPVFQRSFVQKEEWKKAAIRICGLGFYLLEINGRRVGQEILQPAFTAYDKTVLYNTYDISQFLIKGENQIQVTLGNGWFCELGQDCFDFEHAVWKNHLQMICEIYVDGALSLWSDSQWQCREGKWSYHSVRFGENYDAGALQKEWRRASVAKGPGGILKEQKLPGIRIQKYLSPVSCRNGVYDFGKNLAGDVEITVEGAKGETVEIKYGERLDETGKLDQTLIKRHPQIPRNQTDYYKKGTDAAETWHPEFSYKGFRYVQVGGDVVVKNMKARVYFTDLKQAGGFWCSNPVLQRIYEACLWSVRTNFHHIPTDCPHREKNGWTGDAHISSEFALLNLDMEEAYFQYLENLTDCQWKSGQLPCIAPTSVYGYNYQSGPTWDAALILIPWNVYLYTGRKEILEKYYPFMRRYLNYTQQISEEGICQSGLGDFLPMEGEAVCPKGMILSCFVLKMAQIMERISAVLGEEDGEKWNTLAHKIRKAVLEKYYDKCERTESYLSCVLFFELSKDPQKEAGELADLVRRKNHCTGGGIFGSVYTLEMLTKYGYFEDALQMVLQPCCPGFAYMLKEGGGTLWEHWDGKRGSLNHHMRSAAGAWIFKSLTGLSVEESSPGWKHLVFRPRLTSKVPKIKAWHQTPYGKVEVSVDDRTVKITLPMEVTAVVWWKEKRYEVMEGFEARL